MHIGLTRNNMKDYCKNILEKRWPKLIESKIDWITNSYKKTKYWILMDIPSFILFLGIAQDIIKQLNN